MRQMAPEQRISFPEREMPPDLRRFRRTANASDFARVAVLGVYAAALVVAMGRYGIPKEREQVLAWTLGLVLASLLALGAHWHSAAQAVRDWSVFGVLLVVYDYSRGAADWFGLPLQVELPIIIDRALFPGDVPTIELQARLGPFLGQRWWEAGMALVYASHFFVPYIVTAVLWLRNRERWRAWLARFTAVTALGLLGYITLPTMPPWLASRTGHLGEVQPVTTRGWRLLHIEVAGDLIEKGQAVVNHVAAFPSLHAAYPALIAVFFWSRGGVWFRSILVAYPLAMGFTLVIGGEHYVVDILAGWAIVAVVAVVAHRVGHHRRSSSQAPGQVPVPQADEHQPADG